MSHRIEISGPKVQALPSPALDEARFEITYAVFDKATNTWNPANVPEKDKARFEQAVAYFEKIGEQNQALYDFRHQELGSEFIIDEKGIYRKEGKNTVNLLDRREAEPMRAELKKITKAVSNQLKQAAHVKGDVRIEVKVVKPSSAQMIEHEYANEYAFYQELSVMESCLNDEEWNIYLQGKGYSQEEIEQLKEQVVKMKEASQSLLEGMNQTQGYFLEGRIEEGMNYFAAYIQEHFPSYVEAANGLVVSHQVMEGRLGEASLLKLFPQRPELNEKLLRAIIPSAVEELQESGHVLSRMPDEWKDAQEVMRSQLLQFSQETKRTPLNTQLNHLSSREAELFKIAKEFEGCMTHQSIPFFNALRKAGISELEAHYVLGFFKQAVPIMQKMEQGIARARDLSNQRRDEEAWQEYSKVMEEVYPQYCEIVGQLSSVYARLQKLDAIPKGKEIGPFSEAVNTFRKSSGMPPLKGDAKHLSSLIASYTKHVATELDYFIGALETSCKPFKEEILQAVPEAYHDPSKSLVGVLNSLPEDVYNSLPEELIEKLPEGRFFLQVETLKGHHRQADDIAKEQDLLFSTLTKGNHRLEEALLANASDPAWRKNLQQKGWTGKDIQALSEINDAYAKEIEPLYRGALAMHAEPDPQRKRILQAQLKRLAGETIPRLNKITERYAKLGGENKLLQLEKAIDSYRGQNANQERKVENADFALNEIRNLREKVEFLNSFYDADVHFRMHAKEKTVENLLLRGSFTGDPAWISNYKNRQFTPHDFAVLSELYDQLANDMEPVYLAYIAFLDDPDNKMLQKNLIEAARDQADKLIDVKTKITKWGGTARVEELMGAISAYKEVLADRVQNGTPEEKIQAERILAEWGSTDFLKTLTERNEILAECYNGLSLTETWSSHYAEGFLLRSPLFKDQRYQARWNEISSLQGFSQKELKEVSHLYTQISKELAPLQKVERELAADPGNRDLRAKLKRLTLEKENTLSGLLFELISWGGGSSEALNQKLNQLQKATTQFTQVIHTRSIQTDALLSTTTNPKEIKKLKAEGKMLRSEERRWERFDMEGTLKSRLSFLGDLYRAVDQL